MLAALSLAISVAALSLAISVAGVAGCDNDAHEMPCSTTRAMFEAPTNTLNSHFEYDDDALGQEPLLRRITRCCSLTDPPQAVHNGTHSGHVYVNEHAFPTRHAP